MKIALVNDSLLQGRGADQVVFELAKRLGRKHKIDVVTTETDFPEKNFRIKRVKTQRLLTGDWRDFLFFKTVGQFRHTIQKGNYDLINLHHATLAPAFLGMKNVVITYHGSPFEMLGEKGLRKFLRYLANKGGLFCLRYFPKIVAVSYYLKKELIKNRVPQQKIEVIYNGASPEFFPTNQDENFMFFVGRHVPHKRIDQLIQLSRKVNFPLKVAGSGPETEKLKNLTKKLAAPVEFLGDLPKNQLIKYYQSCSFFVSASLWEGFGLIFLEAARCAKPAVAYSTGSIPELIKHKKTGFIASNPCEFEKYVKLLIEDKGERKRMGKEALKESQKFDWDETTRKYLDLFKEITENKH